MKTRLIDKINKCTTMDEIKSLGMQDMGSDSYGNHYMIKKMGAVTLRLNVMSMRENAYAHDVEFDGGPEFLADDDVSGWENQ